MKNTELEMPAGNEVSCPTSNSKQDGHQAPDQVSHGFFYLKLENLQGWPPHLCLRAVLLSWRSFS